MAKRYTRKELKRPDQFQSFWTRVYEFLSATVRPIAMGSAAVLVVIVAVALYSHFSAKHQAESSKSLASALRILNSENTPAVEDADDLIAEYRLEKVADSLGEQLSGGERRRAEVARSLLSNPRYILFDEPFAGVDPIAVGELQRLIGGLRDRGIGVLLTDHNVREALGICSRAYILVSGSILEAGTPTQIAASAKARKVYLGDRFRLDDHPVHEQRTE